MVKILTTPEEAAAGWVESARGFFTITKSDLGYMGWKWREGLDPYIEGFFTGTYTAYHGIYRNWFTAAIQKTLKEAYEKDLTERFSEKNVLTNASECGTVPSVK